MTAFKEAERIPAIVEPNKVCYPKENFSNKSQKATSHLSKKKQGK